MILDNTIFFEENIFGVTQHFALFKIDCRGLEYSEKLLTRKCEKGLDIVGMDFLRSVLLINFELPSFMVFLTTRQEVWDLQQLNFVRKNYKNDRVF